MPDVLETSLEPMESIIRIHGIVANFAEKAEDITTFLRVRGADVINDDPRKIVPLGEAGIEQGQLIQGEQRTSE